MRLTMTLAMVGITALCFAVQTVVYAQAPSSAWVLPQGLAVKDAGPRTYKFVVDYNSANSQGVISQRQRITGEYTRGLPGGEVMWKNVTDTTVRGDETAPLGPAQKVDFMEGFHYRNDLGATMSPDFFKSFPPTPTIAMEKNLVWDTGMIETFGQNYFDHLKLNEPYHAMFNQDVNMPGLGTFHNRDVVLTWIGRSQRNGQDCAVIQYRAFFNPVNLSFGGVEMKSRSDYWGEIWVSLTTKQIEYGTLYENVVGQLKLPGQDAPQPMDVLRIGTFEPIN